MVYCRNSPARSRNTLSLCGEGATGATTGREAGAGEAGTTGLDCADAKVQVASEINDLQNQEGIMAKLYSARRPAKPIMAGRQGLEPRYAAPEAAVLPLDDLPTISV